MYTLEDDQETSSRLNKRDIAEAKTQAGTFGDGGEGEVSDISDTSDINDTEPAESGSSLSKHFSAQQIISSFKGLATPGKANTNGKHVALAALTIACIGVFLTALDQTVVVTALPQIIVDLHIPFTQLDHASWIISAYLLGFIVAMPLMGRVSDIYGRRRIFLLCLLIFGVGSAFCGLAPFLGDNVDLSFLSALDAIHLHIDTSSPGLIWLIAARLFQAIGGGAVVPVAMAIAGDFYGQGRRGLALGIIGAVTEAGGVLGPLYGALIVQHFGWQYIFYLNIPLVGALMIAAWMCIPKGTRLQEGIDWIGAILLGIALTCLSLGLAQQGTELGPATANSAATQNNPIALVLAGVFLIAFVLVERKVRWPVVQLSLFRRFPFSATSLVSLLVGAALIIAMADIPIFVDTILQLPVLDSGLALLRLTAMIPLGALLGGWLCSRISCRFTGVLGLLFTAAGFYLMSRWPIHVDWTQITISTVTAGLGFGLVIAPIGTTAINAVKATQAGMGSAIVTSLRMVGMMLGLAALTSWALAYFKQLVSTYPSLPTTATAAQFAAWSKGYAAHIISSAHTVYSAVFFATMILCLIAILPAIFLWGNKAPEAEEIEVAPASPVLPPEPEPALHEAVTLPVAEVSESTLPTGSLVPLPGEPPIPPIEDTSGNDDKGGRNPKRRRLLIIASIALIFLMIAGGILAAFLLQPNDNGPTPTADTTPGPNPRDTPTPTPIAGPRMMQLAFDKGALTSIFVSQLNVQQGALTDLSVVPLPNDVLVLRLDLHIDANGIHRMMPIELDGVISTDKQQNLSLHVTRFLRDGQDAGPTVAGHMQTAMNQLLLTSVMPTLRGQLKGAKLISAYTSQVIACSKGAVMLVLLIEAPPIEGIAAQPTPVPFCFSGPIDLNKLLPH